MKDGFTKRPGAATVANSWGFTLLEVMVALAILAITLVTLLGSQSKSLDLVAEAHFKTLAPMLAAAKFSELQDRDGLVSAEGDFSASHPGYLWKLSLTETGLVGLEGLEALAELEPPLSRAELEILLQDTGLRHVMVRYGRW